MLSDVADNKLVIENASHNLERINGSIGISAMIIALTVLTILPLASIGIFFVITTLNVFKMIGTFAKDY